jgi:hypothetical protein
MPWRLLNVVSHAQRAVDCGDGGFVLFGGLLANCLCDCLSSSRPALSGIGSMLFPTRSVMLIAVMAGMCCLAVYWQTIGARTTPTYSPAGQHMLTVVSSLRCPPVSTPCWYPAGNQCERRAQHDITLRDGVLCTCQSTVHGG